MAVASPDQESRFKPALSAISPPTQSDTVAQQSLQANYS